MAMSDMKLKLLHTPEGVRDIGEFAFADCDNLCRVNLPEGLISLGDCAFDLTSEQFGDRKLDYANCPEQRREVHFAKAEKRERYAVLRQRLLKALSDSEASA